MTFRIRMYCLVRHFMICVFLVTLLAETSAQADDLGPDLDAPATSDEDLATATLRQMGFRGAVALDGGMKAWREAGYPVTSGKES